MVLLVFTSLLSLFANPLHAHAASLTWDGGGADNNWSTCANWTTDTCPIAGDTVTFNATSTKNSTIDAGAPASVATLTIAAGYTGTITLARTFATTTTFSQATGSFTASNQSFTMAAFTLSGGTFTASSGTTSISGAVTVTGTPTFNHNSGTVNFSGGAATIACNGISLNTATFTNTGLKTISSGCTIPVGSSPAITNAITVNGTLSGSGTLSITTGTFILGTTGTLSGFSGINSGSNVTINGTLNAGSYTTFAVTGSFSLGATSVFTAPSGTLSASGLNFTAGLTFNANGGTVNITGSTSTLSCGSVTFNLVTFNNTAAKTVNSTCTLPLGNNPTIAQGVVLNGTLSGTGTLTQSAGTLTLNSGSSLSGFTGLSVANLTIAGGSFNAGSYTPFTISTAFSMSSGSFTAPGGTMSIGGAFSITAGSFTANGGTVNFNGTTTASIACNSAVFNLVTFTNTAGVKTIGSDCSLPLGNNPTIGSGTTTDFILNGTLSGSGTLTIASAATGNLLTINSAGSLSGFSGLSAGSFAEVNATLDFSSFLTFSLTGTYTQTGGSVTVPVTGVNFPSTVTINSGTFIAPTGTMYFQKALTINPAATFNANGGTTEFSDGTATIICGGATFNQVRFTNTGTKTFNSDCSFELGNNPTFTNSGDIILNGNFNGTGTLSFLSSASLLTIGSANALTGFDSLLVGGSVFIAANVSVDFSNFSSVDIFTNFSQGSFSSFTAPAGVMSIGGDFTVNYNGATFDANGGTITFYGAKDQNAFCGNAVINLVTFNKSAGYFSVGSDCIFPLGNNPVIVMGNTDSLYVFGTFSGTGTLNDLSGILQIDSSNSLNGFTGLNANNLVIDGTDLNLGTYNTLDINSNFSVINNGTFTATSANMTVGGNFTINTGSTFNANGGTVILDGSNQIIMGTTFNNLTKIVASADTLTFPAGGTETILGDLILKGGSATELLTLVSSSPGTPWQIDAQGSRTLQYLDVSDSNNINASVMIAYDSINSGGNTYWTFQDTPIPPTPSPVSPTTKTVTDNTNGYVLHPAGTIEGTVTIVDSNNNNPDNTGRTRNNNPNRTYIFIWWSSIIGILLLASLLAYILYVTDKKNHHT